uniref:aluminum-activated malate transporter 8-like n=1 Tax=Erigeron canadensis TaxID=72917 RepID=UPI001CB8EB39|nr:aluminum-activated malate transporter 8-like [Erigeron canadensis]
MEIVFKPSSLKTKVSIVDFIKRVEKLGKDDPRRIMHSFKVALAITLVSMVYYLRPLYKGIGDAGIWAILTVVVVFEYTAGATLCKGMNRGLATLVAGVLGLGAKYFASLFGPKAEPIVLGCLVFVLVAAATFTRFIPHIKRRYDYGVLIFILTFSLVAVSGYRVDKILELAHQRLSTIILGGATCIIISLCVCPVWAGEDVHNLIISNLEKLSRFLEGFGGEFFQFTAEGDKADESKETDKSFLVAYKSVLNSKATEESLANFAWWEPGHGNFRFSHPWKQYMKIGVLTRQCAYHIEALNGYLDHSKFQASSDFGKSVQEPCTKMSMEAGKALKELALSIKSFSYPSNSIMHLQTSKKMVKEVKTTLQTSLVGEWDLLETIPIITVASILIDIVKCIDSIFVAVEGLSEQARFTKSLNESEKSHLCSGEVVQSVPHDDQDKGFVAVMIHKIFP